MNWKAFCRMAGEVDAKANQLDPQGGESNMDTCINCGTEKGKSYICPVTGGNHKWTTAPQGKEREQHDE